MKKLKTKLAIKLATMSMSERVHEAIFIFTILLSLTGDSFLYVKQLLAFCYHSVFPLDRYVEQLASLLA